MDSNNAEFSDTALPFFDILKDSTIGTPLDKIDRSFYVSTIDTNNVWFYASTPIDSANSSCPVAKWLKFPLTITTKTYVTSICGTVIDSVFGMGKTDTTIAGHNITLYRVRWVRRVPGKYRRETQLSYASHFGMIFIESTFEEYPIGTFHPKRKRTLKSYKFK